VLAAPAQGAPAPQAAPAPVYAVDVQGPVTAATIGYLRRAVQVAEAADAQALLITLSGGGGVLRDIRPFAGELASARVPIVVYVAPGTASGAPGAFLLSGAHISALAPGTSFGSPYPLAQVDAALTDQTRNLVLDSVAEQLREWNEARGRGAEWVDRAVREGIVLSNEQAAAATPPAVDLVAADTAELLTLLEGRRVRLEDGRTVQLSTLGVQPAPVAPTLLESLWLALADPTVAFALLILGAMAIYLELASPGMGVFLGIGLVLLLASGAGLIVLPLRWWGVALMLLGLLLIGAEIVVHTHGALTVAGLAALVFGALNMVDPVQAPGAGVAPWAIGLVALGMAGAAAGGVALAISSRARPVALGPQSLVGKIAEVRRRLDPRGMVFVEGALWQAISEGDTVEPGDWVRVTAVHNLQLIVRPLDTEDSYGGGSGGRVPSET
jgi:membrane-bound serine protease (ClpP class)